MANTARPNTPAGSASSAAELHSIGAVAARFVAQPGVRLILSALTLAVVIRFLVGGMGPADLAVVAMAALLVGPAEWVLHRWLFHAPVTSKRATRLRTGRRHELHHDDPLDLRWLLLDVRGAVLLLVAVAVVMALWALPVAAIVGPSLGGPVVTAMIVGWLGLVHYEWTHLLIHARIGHRTRRYRRLAKHHLAHHYRDQDRWFGVTTNVADRLFGTSVN